MPSTNLKSLIQKLNPICQRTLEAAAGLCLSRSHYHVEIEHWLIKLLEIADNDIAFICRHYGIGIDLLMQDLSTNLARLKTGNAQAPALSQHIIELTREALLLSTLEYSTEKIRSGYLVYALLHDKSALFANISPDSLRLELPHLIVNSCENDWLVCQENSTLTDNTLQSNPKTPALNQFTINLTQLAKQGKIDRIIGRDTEIRQLIDILMRRRQNNPILTGEPGVGKTAVVEGFALRIANGDVPPALQNITIHTLDLGLLQAGAGVKGEFENRLKSIIQEVKSSPQPIILFIDEAHTIVGAGAQVGQTDAANLLKPALARGELRTIAATTWVEYKKYFEQDAALARRFQVIKIEEPCEEIATIMLRGLVEHFEQHHQVRILDEAVTAAVRLSHRYLSNRLLPDKAISALDTACARVAIAATTPTDSIDNFQQRIIHLETEIAILKRETTTGSNHAKRLRQLIQEKDFYHEKLTKLLERWQAEKKLISEIHALRLQIEEKHITQNKTPNFFKEHFRMQKQLKKLLIQLKKLQGETPLMQDCVDAQAIAEIICAWTGIPLGKMVSDDIHQVLNLEQRLQQRIIGQSYALKTIAQNIHTSRAQLRDPCKPSGVFLLIGPSGVGKTETALALAELLYGGEQNMTTINLSEFKEEHKVSLLLGSPPGYVGYGEGGILTEAVRRRPYSLVLLDEIEKAHSGVQDIFYQMFDKGMLKDGQGRDIDFKNSVIIITSNVASDLINKLCADPETMPSMDALIETIKPELLKFFKPAFLGRVTLIPYLSLNAELMQQIVKLQLTRIQQRILTNHQTQLSYDKEVIQHIVARCHAAETGARNIDYLLTRSLLPDLATEFLTAMASNKKINHIQIKLTTAGEVAYEIR